MQLMALGRAPLLAALVATAACANDSKPTPLPFATNAPAGTMEVPLQSMVDAALDDAARRTKLDRSRLEVVSAEQVTWTDGSLGCPQPDLMYTQALVPGYRIRIRAGAEVLDYHSGKRGRPELCPASRSVEPAVGGPT
jgi:hypothetical protein